MMSDTAIAAIRALCAEAGVTRLELCEGENPFSAGAEGPACFIVTTPKTDPPGLCAEKLVELEERLSSVLGREVDLLLPGALRNPWLRDGVGASRVELYPVGQERYDIRPTRGVLLP